MKLSFTLDEKIFNRISPEELISHAIKLGISAIEISPDKRILPLEVYKNIAKLCYQEKIEINYHIPYYADGFLYEIMNINKYPKNVKEKYLELISIVQEIQDIINTIPLIVFHGGKYIELNNKETGLYNTLSFCDWLLNYIEKKNLSIKLALETIDKKQERVIGDTREDVHYIINAFNSKNLGICWDICHDALNFYPDNPPVDKVFLKNIIYCHIHGITSIKGISHTSFKDSFIKFEEQIFNLKEMNFTAPLNLELLVDYSGQDKYLNILFDDIRHIKSQLY